MEHLENEGRFVCSRVRDAIDAQLGLPAVALKLYEVYSDELNDCLGWVVDIFR